MVTLTTANEFRQPSFMNYLFLQTRLKCLRNRKGSLIKQQHIVSTRIHCYPEFDLHGSALFYPWATPAFTKEDQVRQLFTSATGDEHFVVTSGWVKNFHVNEANQWLKFKSPATGNQGWMQEPPGRSDPSFVLRTMHAAQSRSWRALSRLAHRLCHEAKQGKDVRARLQLEKGRGKKKENIYQHGTLWQVNKSGIKCNSIPHIFNIQNTIWQ